MTRPHNTLAQHRFGAIGIELIFALPVVALLMMGGVEFTRAAGDANRSQRSVTVCRCSTAAPDAAAVETARALDRESGPVSR